MRDRLTKSQKTFLIQLIAEGLESDEINERTQAFKKPFAVSKQNINRYRQTRKAQLKTIQAASEESALTTGLALKENRVRALKVLAALLEKDLLDGFLWLEEVKSIGSGDTAREIDYEVFNKAELESYRGVLDDIAREVGDRKAGVTVNWEQKVINLGHDPSKYRAVAQWLISSGLGSRVIGGGDSTGTGTDAAPSASPAAPAGNGDGG